MRFMEVELHLKRTNRHEDSVRSAEKVCFKNEDAHTPVHEGVARVAGKDGGGEKGCRPSGVAGVGPDEWRVKEEGGRQSWGRREGGSPDS